MAIQIGKYRRPGIFIEEFDKSVITSPILEGITNMVIGVSKKGPINTPIRITTINDLETIFGQLDRGLERSGSFFHRTIQKMLETAPVYAINLLATDDTLDTIQYKSLSSAAQYTNDIGRDGAYRRFFDTTGFWSRDTESFLNLSKSANPVGYDTYAFSLTNMSDRYITAFVIKSTRTGFDRTLIEWYGSSEKLPPYVNANDWASDYMVDVVVVGGDWSNYQDLAVNSRWSAYFNSSGLIKSQLSNFANDRNVTLLSYYSGLSLIPYFRDANGNNIFIETTINRDTDKTGLFCAFDSELVESNYYNGMLDLIGNTIVGINEADIEFLSYKETISETIEITQNPLDLPGNVTAMLVGTNSSYSYVNQTLDGHAYGTPSTSGIVQVSNRTAYFGEGYTYNLKYSTHSATGYSTITVEYQAGADAFSVIGDTMIPLSGTTTLTIDSGNYPSINATSSYTSAFVLDSTGDIMIVNNLTGSTKPSVSASDIVLGYAQFNVGSTLPRTISSLTMTNVNIDNDGFLDFKFGVDYNISLTGSTIGSIQVGFIDTHPSPDVKNYEQYRRFKMFNRLTSLLGSTNKDQMTLCLGSSASYKKVSLSTMTLTNIVTSTTLDKSFVLNTGLSTSNLYDILNGYFVVYTVDNELFLGTETITTKPDVSTPTDGVVGKYSKLYTKFYDGTINTGDYFYPNKLTNGLTDIVFTAPTSGTYSGYDFIIFSDITNISSLDYGDKIIIPSSILNTGTFTIVDNSNPITLANELAAPGMYAYRVSENVTNESLFDKSEIYDATPDSIVYLKMYLDNSGLLEVVFTNSEYTPITLTTLEGNNTIYIQSAKSNFKQTIDVEFPTGYTQVPNKVLVNTTRYTEVVPGDFLAAWYDQTSLEVGEVPRKLTRILSKKQYDATYSEISCDSRIDIAFSGTASQTTRYSSIDNYVETYKAITMKGFRIRQASLPNNKEDRQSEILNLVAKGTPLFKAITNKEAIDFRYLIDSFGLGLTERSKQQLVDICGDRLDALGILNMPSMRSFKNSSSPTFVDSDGILQTSFIAQGGDPQSSPAFLYSFGDGSGSTSVGYFLPYVSINDNGRPIDVPPAAWVATTYMRKHTANISGVNAWTIAAGVTNGRITNITKTEMPFTNTDIENLNGAQMNPIVFKRNRGNVIETENTSQTLYKSALSYIHIREVLIELEREMSRMLLDFQWKYNTPDVRAEIKLRADVICETYVNKNGLYNFFNKMDEENNTQELIDNQMGVIDTYVEPIRGMGIIVNNVTILSTGAIAAGGFING